VSQVTKNEKWGADCEKNQLEMNTCASQIFGAADSELNALYRQQMNYLSDKTYKQYLKSSQLEWIKFRDKDCIYQAGDGSGGGSMYYFELFNCRYIHTKRRIEDLKSYVECRENGCPY
jgi:uncharacterized protein YecT (DUF1311 family)